MKSKDIDPSLRAGEPLLESLDDGFSPPEREPQPAAIEGEREAATPAEPVLGTKSPF